MGDTQTPRDDLSDVEYLRTKSDKELESLFRRTKRSRDELSEYLRALNQVIKERQMEQPMPEGWGQ